MDKELFKCNYCDKIFSSKTTLTHHQKTAKFCLNKQGLNNTDFKCSYCLKILSTYPRLNTHLSICKKKKDEDKKLNNYNEADIKLKEYQIKLKEKEEYISKLEDLLKEANKTISEIAKQPKTIQTNSDNDCNYHSEDEDDSKLPSTVYEKLNEAIDTIEDTEEEKDNILIVSTFTLNNITITSRHLDHYVNATQLCQAGNKKFSHWISLDTTKDLITVLSSNAGIPASLLVETKRGRTSKFNQGSWIHPDLAIQLSQWISPSFALQISRWVRTLFNNGSIVIDISLIKKQEKLLNIKDQRIKQLEDACLSKQRRIEYKEKNVIYMLTTDDHLKRRTYIFGKAKNLTTRLGTYNKTCDHTVIYYRECKNEEDMTVIETLVLSKLRDYREKANRDRFILPEDKEVSFFTKIIDECLDFI
jgi:hypothetical protein